MLQDIFRFSLFGHDIAIHGFGLMMVIGFLGAMYLAKYLATRSGLDGELFANATLIGLFTGVLGARMSHVLENLPDFTRSDRTVFQNIFEMFNITSGGLTYYGGFILAFPTLLIYAHKKKIPLRLGMDIVAPCLMVGLAFGRVGCFLNGCCYGAECNLPWAVHFPYGSYAYEDQFHNGEIFPPAALQARTPEGERVLYPPVQLKKSGNTALLDLAAKEESKPVHPAQLYSTLTAFLLAGLLVAFFSIPHAPGTVFALMMVLEGIARFVLEILRVEPPVVYIHGYGLSLSMVLGIVLAIVGGILGLVFNFMGGSTGAPQLRAAAA
ncbi:MAG TPA: prolipoprotein diacylglyceryl transferase [Tepidisphaeraceae bacterium]|jgi:phosphatidylglycerol:prolipoprotein diacylglycerol transferase|nr:prolipoprotein diacylglyceryl transferase [Tepidisphaeraceae bacterium]